MNVGHTIAIDVALLLPEPVVARVVALNRILSAHGQNLRLDGSHLPHITLAQQFVAGANLPGLLAAVAGIARAERPFELQVRGVLRQATALTLAIAHSEPLQRLHESLMGALAGFEETACGESSFLSGGEEIRPNDVDWVAHYSSRSSFGRYQPHITIGHGELTGPVKPLDFVADQLAVCHLGRYCTCRAVLAEWRLGQ